MKTRRHAVKEHDNKKRKKRKKITSSPLPVAGRGKEKFQIQMVSNRNKVEKRG